MASIKQVWFKTAKGQHLAVYTVLQVPAVYIVITLSNITGGGNGILAPRTSLPA